MKKLIQDVIYEALTKLNITYSEDIVILEPKKKENGDFSTNIALKLAGILKEDAISIADKICQNISNDHFSKVEVVKPGFINFFVSKSYLLKNINIVLKEGKDYGRNNLGLGKKYNIEFVSANPTGILHLGNARGGAYGDSLARILRFSGYDVTEEYYINDAGNQVDNLALSIIARYKNICGIQVEIPENGYHGEEIITIAKNLYDEYSDTLLDKDLEYFKKIGIDILLDKIKKVLKEYRINYDVYTSEKEIYKKHPLDKIINELTNKGYTYKKDGALWLKTSELGDDKDHVLVKNDGSYTYLMPDIAYHIDKIERGYNHLIDVFGTDHHGYVARLKGALKALGYDNNILDVKLLQLVKLISNGQEVKMSKRTGKIVSLQELMDITGINAARYFFCMHSLDTQMDFDLDLATKKSNENPVYYVCYAYARICSILKQNNVIKLVEDYHSINSEEAYNVLEQVYKFKEVVLNAAKKELPHLITNYAYTLAEAFHSYYSKNRIITDNLEETNENLNMIQAVKVTLLNALELIGVIPPESM